MKIAFSVAASTIAMLSIVVRSTLGFVVPLRSMLPRVAAPFNAIQTSALFSTASPVNLEDLKAKIKLKGDEIRSLKADGIDKDSLAPHLEELKALKDQLPVGQPDTKPPKGQMKEPKKQQKAQVKSTDEMSESELRVNRLSKVNAMRAVGIEPFEYSFSKTHTANQLMNNYNGKLADGEEDEAADVSVAGRIMTRRVFGKLAFFTMQDESGVIQLQLDKGRLGDSFEVR